MEDIKILNAALLFLFQNHSTFHDPAEFNKIFFEKGVTQRNPVIVLEALVDDGYVLKETRTMLGGSTYDVYIVSAKGIKFIEGLPSGYGNNPYGFHTELIKRQEEQAEEIRLLNLEKLKYDVRNSRRIFKTYWWTFTIAIAGFVISAILLVLKINGK